MSQVPLPRQWRLSRSVLPLEQGPLWMGIVNVTPDSFSDGGQWFDPQRAVEQALQLVQDGAAILDIGGESTRPYSDPVAADEERRRVIPVIEQLARQTDVPISIDTSKSVVARAALDAGAQIINDVTGLEGDPQMIDVARSTGAGVCAMHMRGTPQTMQDDPRYDDVVQDIRRYLRERQQGLLQAGLDLERICLDPGIGFGKTHDHNLQLLRHIDQFLSLGSPLLVGHSRKGFIASVLADKAVERDSGTLGVSFYLAQRGVQIIRVHNVGLHTRAWRLWQAVVPPSEESIPT
jgi:dihydropteroate synthase